MTKPFLIVNCWHVSKLSLASCTETIVNSMKALTLQAGDLFGELIIVPDAFVAKNVEISRAHTPVNLIAFPSAHHMDK